MHSTKIRFQDFTFTVHHNGDFSGAVQIITPFGATDLDGEKLFSIRTEGPDLRGRMATTVPFGIMPTLTALWLTTLAEEALEDGDFTRLIQLSTALATIQHEIGDSNDTD